MRAILGRLSLLVVAAGLAGSASMAGCSSTTDDPSVGSKDQGSIAFKLDVGGGATINTMHVVVYGNSLGAVGAATNIVKDLDVGGITGPTASFTLTLPAGTNYQVKVSSPDNTTCGGTGTFNVIAGQSNTSTLNVTMSCASTDMTGGETVGVTACTPPVVNSVFVGPNTQAVGHIIQLMASVEAGSTVQWAQSGVGAGTFVSSSAATTNFTCTSAGAITLQLGLTMNGCATTKSYAVNCTGPVGGGGGGATGAGGAAAGGAPAAGAPAGGAPAAGAPAGGAPAAGAPAGGAPAGGAPAGGAPAGGAPAGGAPAGGAPAGGAPAGGSTGCPSSTIVNGNGTGQVCAAAFTVDDCGATCSQITAPSCIACENADIAAGNACYDDGVTGDGSSVLNIAASMTFNGGTPTATNVAAGNKLLACLRTTKCAKAGPTFTACYCGTTPDCTTPGNANGPCRAEMEAALETTSPAAIGSRFIDYAYAGGVVNNRISCDRTNCNAACLQ